MKLQNIGLIGFGGWIESAYLPILNSKTNAIKAVATRTENTPVSYTHLTLPTKA